MIENRCHRCKALLFKMEGEGQVEIICPKCRNINYLNNGVHDPLGLRGMAFQAKAFELKSPDTGKIFCRVIGTPKVEVQCRITKKMYMFDLEERRRNHLKKLPKRKQFAQSTV